MREKATFTLEALDDEGERVYRGGDPIFVSIQGVTRARARIDDHEDGTYTVRWRPIQSGPYKIVVSNLGKPLPGSPFICIASTPEPCPEQCQVNGSALTACMARETQNFAVSFRDQLGAVTHAVDLDVFVEPLPSSAVTARLPLNPRSLLTRACVATCPRRARRTPPAHRKLVWPPKTRSLEGSQAQASPLALSEGNAHASKRRSNTMPLHPMTRSMLLASCDAVVTSVLRCFKARRRSH